MPVASKILSWSLHNPRSISPNYIDFESCFNLFSEYEKKLELVPTNIGLAGKDYPTNRIISYSTGVKKLEANKFKNLTSISLYTSKHDGQDFAFDWDTLFSISWRKTAGVNLYAGIDTAHLVNNPNIVAELIAPACDLIKPILGYAYTSVPADGPFAYSIGSIHTPQNDYLTEDHKELILAWSRDQDAISSGKIRDLYPDMVLSPVQLAFIIDGKSLQDWILSDPQHGVLEPLSKQNTYWKIPISSYPSIRNTLAQAGMLIAYDQFIFPTILS